MQAMCFSNGVYTKSLYLYKQNMYSMHYPCPTQLVPKNKQVIFIVKTRQDVLYFRFDLRTTDKGILIKSRKQKPKYHMYGIRYRTSPLQITRFRPQHASAQLLMNSGIGFVSQFPRMMCIPRVSNSLEYVSIKIIYWTSIDWFSLLSRQGSFELSSEVTTTHRPCDP